MAVTPAPAPETLARLVEHAVLTNNTRLPTTAGSRFWLTSPAVSERAASMLRGAAIVILSTIIAIACVEAVLRAAFPVFTTGIQTSYQYDDELGIRLRDNTHRFRVTDHQEEIVSNSLGTANFEREFASYSQIIFALGDSYTQGTGLAADQSYPFQLGLTLNQDSSGSYLKRYGVVNLGLAAFGGEQSLIVLKRYSERLGGPVACLYLGSENDFDDDLLFKSGGRHRHVVNGSPRYGRLVPILLWVGNLQLALRVKTLVASHRLADLRARAQATQAPAALGAGGPAEPQAKSNHDVVNFDSPSTHQRPRLSARSVAELEWPVISRIVAECRARGAQTILAWSATPVQSESYPWLRDRARENGLPFNDWYPRVQQVREAIPSLPLQNPHSGGHYRGWVAHEIAEGFASGLKTMIAGRALRVGSEIPIR